MIFSKSCEMYLKDKSCPSLQESEALKFINESFPISTSNIDWSITSNIIDMGVTYSNDLKGNINNLVQRLKKNNNDSFYIINLNSAFPSLISNISDWLIYISELDFPDTLFISTSFDAVIHWDFYKNLYGKGFYFSNEDNKQN